MWKRFGNLWIVCLWKKKWELREKMLKMRKAIEEKKKKILGERKKINITLK